MGKRTRKTRWRTLAIGDEQSDSEESNSTLDTRLPPSYHQKYYGRFTYSSQSTPTRRYQSDSTKSTRSSSTASENKITFNEDEYTRITTPRQDVLFKKGYLNKPKTYSTQTSTGNSTTSTGNSTGNGTPDYQSTDLEYESQFVFPNGFLDQNGVYYINSYDSYPLMVYSPAPYYGSDACARSKKYSTESLAETASTSNEENSQDATNQHDAVGHEEATQDTSTPVTNGHHPHAAHHHHHQQDPHHVTQGGGEFGQVYNVVYPGFYYNGLCPPQELANGQGHQSEPKKIKRRRRRKLSQSKTDGPNQNGTTSEYTEDDTSSSEDELEEEDGVEVGKDSDGKPSTNGSQTQSDSSSPVRTNENTEPEPQTTPPSHDDLCQGQIETVAPPTPTPTSIVKDNAELCESGISPTPESNESDSDDLPKSADTADNPLINISDTDNPDKKIKYDLKPDAQEFVPRCMRPETIQYFKIPPNYVPVPLLSPMGAQNFNPAYFPPGMPVNFIHQNPPMYPGYMPGYMPPSYNQEPHVQPPMNRPTMEEPQRSNPDVPHEVRNKGDIDIRTVVSKLEEVANEPQISEGLTDKNEKTLHNNSSPYRKPGQFRYQEDRKKFFQKNNTQNGYYQRRERYNKFHNNHQGETIQNHTHFKEDNTSETKDFSRVSEEILVNGDRKETYENDKIQVVGENKEQASTGASGDKTENHDASSSLPSDFTGSPAKCLPLPSHQQFEEKKTSFRNEGTQVQSPKFQQKPPQKPNHPDAIPKINVRENMSAPVDPRKKWLRKEDRIVTKRDQIVQHPEEKPNYHFKTNESPTKFNNNRRFNPNSPAKKQNGYDSLKFSETLKKAPQSSPIRAPAAKETLIKSLKETKPALPEVNNTHHISKTQWISVSSKKKRKNRNLEDSEENCDISEEAQDVKVDEFEKNDFLQSMIDNALQKTIESKPNEEITEIITESVAKIPAKLLEVRDLEKELLGNVGIDIKEEQEVIPSEEAVIEPSPKQKSGSKKKSKKGIQKPPTKRVIITDIDLSESLPEAKPTEPVVEIEENIEDTTLPVKEVELVEPDALPVKEMDLVEPKIEETISVEKAVIPSENTEKKSKKKKKKQQQKSSEAPPSDVSIDNSVDTFDFLLENTILVNNSDDKTNMEISQELDLIIQRGMYSNLEEKVKSLNIIPIKDEFFQSVVRTSRESSIEKTPQFTKLLVNSMPKFKYCMASIEDTTSKIPLSHLNEPSTSKSGLFVENEEVNELLKDIYGVEASPEKELRKMVKTVSPPKDLEVKLEKEPSVEKVVGIREPSMSKEKLGKEKLYPITEAVKNWMSKTRENTPEVEILKSPSVIFKEFCEKSEDEVVLGDHPSSLANGKRTSVISESDEEITVYSASRNDSDGVDLLDCWENEITAQEKTTSVEVDAKKHEDDVLEVYESKYGQNEDYLELQKEIEDRKKLESEARSRNFPKHGALPYRAICCNVM